MTSHDLSGIEVSTTVPRLESKSEKDDNTRKVHTLAMISEEYPPDKWVHVYTDGSATNAVKNGGAGIVIHHPNGSTKTASAATGVHCSTHDSHFYG